MNAGFGVHLVQQPFPCCLFFEETEFFSPNDSIFHSHMKNQAGACMKNFLYLNVISKRTHSWNSPHWKRLEVFAVLQGYERNPRVHEVHIKSQ